MSMTLLERWCPECEAKLPEDAHTRRLYCSPRCQDRAKKRRQRAGGAAESETTRLKRQLAEARRRIIELETGKAQSRGRAAEQRAATKKAKSAARKMDDRIRGVRGQLATENIRFREQLAAVRAKESTGAIRGASATGAEDMATLPELRQQLAVAVRERDMATARSQHRLEKYRQLAQRYNQLAADRAALAKEHGRMKEDLAAAYDRSDELEGIIQDWDYLARELAPATGGRGRDVREQRLLAIWQAWTNGHAQRGQTRGQAQEAGR